MTSAVPDPAGPGDAVTGGPSDAEPGDAEPSAGAVPSPNIWTDPGTYEIENDAVDPDGAIEAAMARVQDWAGLDVLDLGCGTGYHLPRFARTARNVIGVEPHPPLVAAARDRTAGLDRVTVLEGTAQRIPVPDHSIDISHSRWAYFFGAGSEPGLVELERVLRPGGVAFVIDNDATRSTFGGWFQRAWPEYDALAVERWWARQGWSRERVDMRWAMRNRADFEAVVRLEFAPAMADAILAGHPGTEVDYAVNLWWRRF